MTVAVDAQWALYGRASDTAGARVLSCSTGELNRDNFGEVISRFSPGTPDALPQVTVSYVASGTTDGNYLALAIHKYADADRDVRSDETGRPVVFTSYFCVPYLPLASAAIGYTPLYLALRSVKLPAHGSGPPRRITVDAAITAIVPPVVTTLARQIAALLVTTGRPACVIGANSASLAERLQFLDTVMAQLPYGQRTRMTAATWVRPTHRDHRFRLYFSDAARDHDPPDHVVWWGRPEQTSLTPAHGSAFEYQRFLEDETRQSAARLPGLTDPHGFKLDDRRELLVGLGITEPEAGPDDDAQSTQWLQVKRTTPSKGHASAEAVLEMCAAHAKAADLTRFAADTRMLHRLATSDSPSDRQRERYRELIANHGLLKHNPELGQQEGKLYEGLLALAFGKPLDYRAYCQIEDCLKNPQGTPPHKSLLRAIRRVGMGDAPVTAIVLTLLRDEQQLHRQFTSSLFDAVHLIDLLGGKWDRPQHFRIVCDVTLDYLTIARDEYDRSAVLRALRGHGFLAQALRSSGSRDQYQVAALHRLLMAVFSKDKFDRRDIVSVLRPNRTNPVTAALFAAVLVLAKREDVATARDAYAVASLANLNLDANTASQFDKLLPVLNPTSGDFVKIQWGQTDGARGGTGANNDAPKYI